MKMLSRLPRIPLNLNLILDKADRTKEVLSYESDVQGIAYASSKTEVIIISRSNGYLRIRLNDIDKIHKELQAIKEDMGCKRWTSV